MQRAWYVRSCDNPCAVQHALSCKTIPGQRDQSAIPMSAAALTPCPLPHPRRVHQPEAGAQRPWLRHDTYLQGRIQRHLLRSPCAKKRLLRRPQPRTNPQLGRVNPINDGLVLDGSGKRAPQRAASRKATVTTPARAATHTPSTATTTQLPHYTQQRPRTPHPSPSERERVVRRHVRPGPKV